MGKGTKRPHGEDRGKAAGCPNVGQMQLGTIYSLRARAGRAFGHRGLQATLSHAHRGELMGWKVTGSGGDCGEGSRDRPKASPAPLGLAATQAQAQSDLTFQEMPEIKLLHDIPLSEYVSSTFKRASKHCSGKENMTASWLQATGHTARGL